MLFSNDEVATFLSDRFECAWESVRPVPRAEIDFGNGHKLTRTINGNIATYFCTPDGRVFDLLPGLVQPLEFQMRSSAALALHASLGDAEDAASTVRNYHRWALKAERAEIPVVPDVSKGRVERTIRKSLLDEDTAYNREHRYPKAHELLAANPLVAPSTITKTVYRDILHVDLDDPYLGLAPEVLGGEGGRH